MLYNPIYEFDTLRKVANEIFGNMDHERSYSRYHSSNIYGNDNGYLLQLKVPGVKQEDISVDFEKGYLTLSVRRTVSNEELKDAKQIRTERSDYDFTKRYAVPEDAEIDKIDAQLKDGLLMIHFPKREEVLPKKITVEVK